MDEPFDGYTNRNSYYESLNIPETTAASSLEISTYTELPAEDEAILSAVGASGDYERMLHFVLNERSRELYGEFLRWEDLAWGNPCVFFKHFAKVAVAQVQRGGQFGKVNVLVELGAHLKFDVFHGDFEGRALKLPVFHLNS